MSYVPKYLVTSQLNSDDIIIIIYYLNSIVCGLAHELTNVKFDRVHHNKS
jgi:hypothetical protein